MGLRTSRRRPPSLHSNRLVALPLLRMLHYGVPSIVAGPYGVASRGTLAGARVVAALAKQLDLKAVQTPQWLTSSPGSTPKQGFGSCGKVSGYRSAGDS